MKAYEDFISTLEVAKTTGYDVFTIRRYAKTGKLKMYRPGPKSPMRFKRSEVEEFMKPKPPEENLPYSNMRKGKAIWNRIQSRLTVEEKAKIAESSFKTTGLYLKTMRELEKKYPAATNNES